MRRKEDRSGKSLQNETSYKTKENIFKTTAGGRWLHKMGAGVVVVGDVVSFVIQIENSSA